MTSFWKNAGVMATAEIFLKLKAFIMMPFITKYLGTLNYGIWSQVMVIVSVFSPLVFFGMDNSLARFLPGKPLAEQKKEFTGWLIFGLFNSLMILAIIACSRHWFSIIFFGGNDDYPLFVLLAGINVISTALLTGIRNWFRIQSRALAIVFLTVLQNLMQMLVLILILINQLGLHELVLWSLVTDFSIVLGYIVYLYFKDVFKKPSLSWLKPYFRFGVVFLPAGYAVWVLNSLDRVFLAHYHTLEDIGIYSIGFTFGYTLIQMIVNPIWNLFPTRAAELYNQNNIDELNILFNQSIKFICWIIFPSILGLALIGDSLLAIITTNDFVDGYLVIPIILTGYLFLMLSAYFEFIVILKNKPWLSTYFTLTACFVNVALNFILIPRFSYMGAAIATMLSFLVQLILSVIFALKENLIVIEIVSLRKIILSSSIMFALVLCLKLFLYYKTSSVSLIILSLAGMVLYLYLTNMLNIYNFRASLMSVKKDYSYV
jgi:O-antigen/teichoic acid export membrane protein